MVLACSGCTHPTESGVVCWTASRHGRPSDIHPGVQSCSRALYARQATAVLTDLARHKGPGMNGLTLGEEVWVLASSSLGRL